MMSEIMYTLKGALLDLIDGFYNWKNIHLRYTWLPFTEFV